MDDESSSTLSERDRRFRLLHESNVGSKPIQPTLLSDWRRHVLGLVGLIFLAVSFGIFFSGTFGASGRYALGISFKSGLILVALWLALPSIQKTFRKFPTWMWYIGGLVLGAAVLQRNMLLFVGALFFVLLFFQMVSWFLGGLREKS